MRILPLLTLAGALTIGYACAADRSGGTRDDDTQRELASALARHVRGPTSQCIDPQQIDGPQIIGDRTLIYRRGSTLYRNDLVSPCPTLNPTATLITEVKTGQLCRNDMFRTIEPGETIPSQYCRLGDFVRYDPVRK